MADQLLTQLPELTTPAADDWLYIVDKSDTTDSPAGTSKKIEVSNLSASSIVPILTPSGGDDTPFIVAAAEANNGYVRFFGRLKLLTPLVLVAQESWRTDGNRYKACVLDGMSRSSSSIDASALSINTHVRIPVTNITMGTTTVATVASGHGFVDGDKCIVCVPSLTTVGNTIENLQLKTVYVKNLTATTIELVRPDSAVPGTFLSINSSSWTGAVFANPTYLRKYSNTLTVPAAAAIRFTFPNLGANDASGFGAEIRNCTIDRGFNFPNGYDRQGVAVAFEVLNAGSYGNSSPNQGTRFDNVRFSGFDCAVMMDDCTNFLDINCDYCNNNYAYWKGFNCDILKHLGCRYGDDPFLPNEELQEVSAYTLIEYLPNGLIGGNNSGLARGTSSLENFEQCWFMGVAGISLNTIPTGGVTGSAVSSITNASAQVTLKDVYMEQIRQIIDIASVFSADGLHLGSFTRGQNLTNNVCLMSIGLQGGVAVGSFKNISVDSGTPINGYVQITDYNGASENLSPVITWQNNRCKTATGKGHLISTAGKMLLIKDSVNVSDGDYARGAYSFTGCMQTGGDHRFFKRTEAVGTPSFRPLIYLEGSNHVVPMLGANCTVSNPGVDSSTSFAATFAIGLNDFRVLKLPPLQLIFRQDITGGRTISFDTEFVLSAGNAYSGGAFTMAVVEFKFNGRLWVQTSPAIVWTEYVKYVTNNTTSNAFDDGSIYHNTSGTNITHTLNSGMGTSYSLKLRQGAAGTYSIVAGAGVTLTPSTLVTAGVNQAISVVRTGVDTYNISVA